MTTKRETMATGDCAYCHVRTGQGHREDCPIVRGTITTSEDLIAQSQITLAAAVRELVEQLRAARAAPASSIRRYVISIGRGDGNTPRRELMRAYDAADAVAQWLAGPRERRYNLETRAMEPAEYIEKIEAFDEMNTAHQWAAKLDEEERERVKHREGRG